jgi:xanthine dehydrogenase accessory factor
MQTLDHDVLQRLAIWLTREERPWLCTIVRTSGSSPRPVGSMLGVLEAGEQVGTVSGGCVEEDLLERIGAGEFSGASPKLVEYGVSAQENERLGLPCGGKLVLLIEQLNTGDSSWITAALAAIGQRQCMERHLDLDTGITQIRAVAQFTSLALSSNRLRHCFGPRMRMLLIGAGQLAQLDISPEQLARLHAPVGLAIGSKAPLEISVAIMAELTQLRRGSPGP